MSNMANYHEFDELPAWTRAVWDGDKVVNDADPYKWSGDGEPPPIGATVRVYMNKFGNVEVIGYFAEYGWLGILADVLDPPAWWLKQNNGKLPKAHFYGVDLHPRKRRD